MSSKGKEKLTKEQIREYEQQAEKFKPDDSWLSRYTDKVNFDQIGEAIVEYAKVLGQAAIQEALTLWEVAVDKECPKDVRAAAFGALAYLGFPLDFIPDFVPIAGMSDDISILAFAIYKLTDATKPHHYERAKARMIQWNLADEDEV
jgi:uncharacterized membrane protein YkvA (DUF1232 family)